MTNNPLLPNFIIQQDSLGQKQGTLVGATQFVDISGFTPLTEKLMSHGKVGAEVLGATLRKTFNPLVEAVAEAGGFITGFAGDAFTAIYPAREDRDVAAYVLQASRQMQAFFTEYGDIENEYGTFTFSGKVGLSWGEVDWEVIEFPESSPTYYFCGQGVDGCANSEKHADKGDIILDQAFLSQCSNTSSFSVVPVVEGYFRAKDIDSGNLPIVKQESVEGDGSRFIPQGIANFPRTGEFRRVSVVFLSFEGVEDLSAFAGELQSALQRFRGTFTRFDFGDKGGNCLMFFGVPTSHENNEERAVDFILEVMSMHTEDVRLRAGVTQNIMYAGFNGGEQRHEFACLGRAVTMAARLMMKAGWGEVWCGPKVYHRTSHQFKFSHIGDLPLKGFADPVALHRVHNRQSTSQILFSAVAMVGREGELNLITERVTRTLRGQFGGIIYIDGEPGMGKSYLVASSRTTLDSLSQSLPHFWNYAPTNQTVQGSFHPFAHALGTFTNQSPGSSMEENLTSFERAMQELRDALPERANALRQELERVHSFLAALLGLYLPGSLYEKLEPRLRFDNTMGAITTWIQALCCLQPVVLQFEDGHWSDPASVTALENMLLACVDLPLIVLMTNRYLDDGTPFRISLSEDIPSQEINLNQLSRLGLKSLATSHLGESVDDSLLDLLEEKARGNPFFVEQILNFLMEQDALISTDSGLAPAGTGVILPEEVNSVLIARLDRLESKVKNVVQIASTLGREFDSNVLAHMVEDQDMFTSSLREAGEAQIWKDSGPQLYLFIHALMRDAAYDMQARARLRQLHLLAGEAFEQLSARFQRQPFSELAYHFELAEDWDKACEYLEKAGDDAKDNYRNEEALGFYKRLLLYIPETGDLARRVFLSVAQVLQLLRRMDEGLEFCEKAEQTHPFSSPAVRYQKAFLTQMKGDFDSAKALIEEASELAREQNKPEWEARCLNSLGVLSLYRGDTDEAGDLLERSLQSAVKAEIPAVQVKAISNLAGVAMARKDLELTQELLERSIELAQNLNDRWTEFLSLGNLGELFLQMEKPDDALKVLEASKRVGEEIGSKNPAFLANYSESLRRMGRIGFAEEIASQAEQLARASGNSKHIIDVLLVKANIFRTQKDLDSADEFLKEALERATSTNQKSLQAKVEKALLNLRAEQES